VLLEPRVAAEWLSQLVNALSGEAVLKGRSMFAARLGRQLGSELVTLVDDSGLPGGLGSAPFDGEGVPGGRTVLIEGGVLRGFLHNTFTARRAGAASTGNAVRASYRSTPEVGATNFSLEAPSTSCGRLIQEVERGLLVLATRNVGGINPINGDYSVGASGVWIERGEEAGPVSGVTIAANMLDMLAGLAAAGDDLRWIPGPAAIGVPTLRIEGMTIAGA
jgi:PmbA protein